MDRFAAIRPYTPPSGVYEVWGSEFGVAYEEGGCSSTMHLQIIGHRSRMAMLEKLVQYMRSRPGVWVATHEQVARFSKEKRTFGDGQPGPDLLTIKCSSFRAPSRGTPCVGRISPQSLS